MRALAELTGPAGSWHGATRLLLLFEGKRTAFSGASCQASSLADFGRQLLVRQIQGVARSGPEARILLVGLGEFFRFDEG